MLQIENKRLDSENQQLLEAKLDQERLLTSEVERLTRAVENSKAETEIISKEYDSLREKILSKHLDGLQAWKEREKMITEAYAQMEGKLGANVKKYQRIEAFVKDYSKLEGEEQSRLRTEAQEIDKYLQLQENRLAAEKKELTSELNCMKDRLNACEEFYQEVHDSCKEEVNILRDTRATLSN